MEITLVGLILTAFGVVAVGLILCGLVWMYLSKGIEEYERKKLR